MQIIDQPIYIGTVGIISIERGGQVFVGYLFIVLILLGWFLGWIIKGWMPLGVLLIFSVIFFSSFTTLNIDLLLKFLFLLTGLLLIFKGMVNFRLLVILLCLSILIYICSIYGDKYNNYYHFIDSLTAFATFITGIIFYSLKLSGKDVVNLLKLISLLPIISLILGIPFSLFGLTDFFSRSGTAVGGVSVATNLSFFGTLATFSSVILEKKTHDSRYNILKIVNFIIVCTTLTRGGILATLLILFPDIFSLLTKVLKSVRNIVLVFGGLTLGAVPVFILVREISKRSFENGELNTSGRLDAWKNILNLVNNSWTGNGYGSLKTLTDNPLLRAFTAAHNAYVQSYFETGVIGTILFIIILLIIFINTLKSNILSHKYIVVAIISFLTYSYTDNTIVNFRYWFVFMIILGCVANPMIAASTEKSRSEDEKNF
ncbi:O-antigen ligase family protein [Leuconostoc lactis]|uniref:O-antigen ligase family protein n=1 Tax=Leuconostoc lactis TaxID=1246 RepID=UPI0025B0988F|nr:O-antigen ligase family protein [Leuconostoc lactis]MDN2649369.1 O-antigen ligase family protein [Leuconostoc lactis]